MNKIDVSFITINYNSSDFTIKLVESIILKTIDLSFEIVVVDNSSKKEDFQNLYNNLNSKSIGACIESFIHFITPFYFHLPIILFFLHC